MGFKVVLLVVASLLLALSSNVSSRLQEDQKSRLPVVSAPRRPPTSPKPTPPPQGTYSKLVQSWAPGYCSTNPCAKFRELGDPQSFYIHGLWPANCFAKPVKPIALQDIENLMDNNRNLQNEMNTYWPTLNFNNNTAFWFHEWDNHGRCQTSLGLQDYFQRTLRLAKRTDLLKTLTAKNIVPGKLYKEPSYRMAIRDKTGQEPLLRCGNGNVLSEVVLCVDEQAQNFIPCPGQSSAPDPSKCKQGDVMFLK